MHKCLTTTINKTMKTTPKKQFKPIRIEEPIHAILMKMAKGQQRNIHVVTNNILRKHLIAEGKINTNQ